MNEGSASAWRAIVLPSGAMPQRLAGCLLGFLVFALALTLADYLGRLLPAVLLQVTSIVLGAATLHLVSAVARRRWHLEAPDSVGILLHDLNVVRRLHGPDFRVGFEGIPPVRERVLNQVLYTLKWCAHLLIFAGFGSLLYEVMLLVGIVKP